MEACTSSLDFYLNRQEGWHLTLQNEVPPSGSSKWKQGTLHTYIHKVLPLLPNEWQTVHFLTAVRNLNRLGYSKNSCPRSKDTPILYSYPTQKPTKFVVWVTKNWTQNWPTTWNWLTLLYMCLALLGKKNHFEYLWQKLKLELELEQNQEQACYWNSNTRTTDAWFWKNRNWNWNKALTGLEPHSTEPASF